MLITLCKSLSFARSAATRLLILKSGHWLPSSGILQHMCATDRVQGARDGPVLSRRRCFCTDSSTGDSRFWSAVHLLQPEGMVTTTEMKRFFAAHGMVHHEGHTCFSLSCSVCAQRGARDAKVHVDKWTARFVCYGCRSAGVWTTFKDLVSMLQRSPTPDPSDLERVLSGFRPAFPKEDEMEKVRCTFDGLTPVADLDDKEFNRVLRQFRLRRLQVHAFRKYDVRIGGDSQSLFFPLHGPDGSLVGMKMLHSVGSEMTVFPKSVPLGLFGLTQLPADSKEIVLTSSPMDAMAAAQETDSPVVSLPEGYAHLSPEIVPWFEPFEKIVLWFGNEMPEWEAAKTFVRKLGDGRCHLVRPLDDHPRPLVALQKGKNLCNIIHQAQAVKHEAITTFRSLRDDVLMLLRNADQASGVRWTRFAGLNRILKGHRRGEMTVFTGLPGSGKTTFLSEYSLDLSMQGVRTLWGSFEVQNKCLAKVMLTQFAGINLEQQMDRFDEFVDHFGHLPLFFMKFHGQQSINEVLDAMTHAVYVHDIVHVVIDNVNFMLGDGWGDISDRLWQQDVAVSRFRQFATFNNCHVTLVMHTRKEKNEADRLDLRSVWGGAKAVQEADNVLILQEKRFSAVRSQKYIEVAKNRFSGDVGIIPLGFNKDTYSMVLTKPQHHRANRKKDAARCRQSAQTVQPPLLNT